MSRTLELPTQNAVKDFNIKTRTAKKISEIWFWEITKIREWYGVLAGSTVAS